MISYLKNDIIYKNGEKEIPIHKKMKSKDEDVKRAKEIALKKLRNIK